MDGELTMAELTGAARTVGTQEDGGDAEEMLGLYQKSDEELVKQVRLWVKESTEARSASMKTRRECHKMFEGDHWAEEDLARAPKLPKLTLNYLLAMVSAVEGEERTNKQEIRYYGTGQEDDPAAAGFNKLLKWVLEGNGGDFEMSSAFRNMLIGGEGWIVPDVDFFDDPEGNITLTFVDDEEMYPDPLSSCPVASDARYIGRIKMLSMDEAEAMWPGKFREAINRNCMERGIEVETDGKGYPDIYLTPDSRDGPKIHDAKSKMWSVIEMWWTQVEPGWIVIDEATGLWVETTEEGLATLREQRALEQTAALEAIEMQAMMPPTPPMVDPMTGLAAPPPALPQITVPPTIQAEQRPVKCVYSAFVTFDTLLEKAKSQLKGVKRPIYVPIRGVRRKVKGDFMGLVEPLIDVQKQLDTEQSMILQLIQQMPKQSWMGPKGSFHNKQDWAEKAALPGQMLEYNAQRGKPEQIGTPPIPRHLIDMAFTRPQTMREISGVNVELTGQRQGSDPGVVMEMRAKAAKSVLAPMFDNFRRSKKELGKILLAYLQAFVRPERRIRVLGPEGSDYVEMTLDMQAGRYDVVVEEANSTINDRIATLNIMQTTLPGMLKAGVPVPPSFVDILPMDPHIREEWKRIITWQMTKAGALPPPDWKPGMPVPMPAPPMPGMMPGMMPPEAAPAAPIAA